jgi:hypothetical protein
MPFQTCPTCADYADRRRPVLVPAMREHCDRTGETPGDCLIRYMRGVHHRHAVLELSLEPR